MLVPGLFIEPEKYLAKKAHAPVSYIELYPDFQTIRVYNEINRQVLQVVARSGFAIRIGGYSPIRDFVPQFRLEELFRHDLPEVAVTVAI